jgi:hypothetical protein
MNRIGQIRSEDTTAAGRSNSCGRLNVLSGPRPSRQLSHQRSPPQFVALFDFTEELFGGQSFSPENASIQATPPQYVAVVHGHLNFLESRLDCLSFCRPAEALIL